MARMLRIEVREDGRDPLAPIDVGEAAFIIGSSPAARVRLPAEAAAPEHVRITDGSRYTTVDGAEGDIGTGVTVEIGSYRLRIAPAPAGSTASPPQRTESLARELMRNLLGEGAAPSLEVERGPTVGATRKLPPPESTLVIGRGDEAHWILLDEDLSRSHAEVRRSWDGTRIVDLGSKNGTRVDGVAVLARGDGTPLRDGALVELGKVVLRFRDPADRQLAASSPPAAASAGGTAVASPSALRSQRAPAIAPASPAPSAPPAPVETPARASTLPFYAALAIMLAALGGLVWVLSL